MNGETLDFKFKHLQRVLMANLLQKFSDRAFYVTIDNTAIGSLKSLHTLFVKYLDHMLVKFEQNHIVQNVQNFELFDKKPSFF